ncbi:MAG TPA: 2,3-bisphosphoglycerate-independent phosphoglycerate mutase, partial [Candidatus Thermoplasmatota archaeon]|nr:2,3-bisphosphoglycerate-independent phosphoglycerate mutase [Candidatus Thermoplasmatota archaeon]
MVRPRFPVLLLVIDGWGIAPPGPHNAITLAKPRNMERLAREFPATELDASGPEVGLPEGQMGNSEVGHLNIGAGRIVDQDFVRINKAVETGALGDAPALHELLAYCKAGAHALHVMGLLGPGGVHAHGRHLLGAL